MAGSKWNFPEYPENWEEISRQVKERDYFTCQYCGSTEKPLFAHHGISLSHGGSNKSDNLITLCEKCHRKEHPHLMEQETWGNKIRGIGIQRSYSLWEGIFVIISCILAGVGGLCLLGMVLIILFFLIVAFLG